VQNRIRATTLQSPFRVKRALASQFQFAGGGCLLNLAIYAIFMGSKRIEFKQKRMKLDFLSFFKDAKYRSELESIPNIDQHFLNLQTHNPLLDFMSQVLFVVDFRTAQYLYLSPNCLSVVGYTTEECYKLGPLKYMDLFHPKDYQNVIYHVFPEGQKLCCQLPADEIFNLRISYNFRLVQKNGTYKTLVMDFNQLMIDEEYFPLVIMGTLTDITEVQQKHEMFCRIQLRKRNGKWEKLMERFYQSTDQEEDFGLTPKEMEIIRFVYNGLSSKEIANRTQRSTETIKSQRKSILTKTGCQRMTDVIVLAGKNGWV
jgi:DNA-binding CsgD family transcriptional regulator